MRPPDEWAACAERELLEQHALSKLAPAEATALTAHLGGCARCRDELESVRATVSTLAAWPGEELRPSVSLWSRLAQRVGAEGWTAVEDELDLSPQWPDIEWEQPGPGIYCKVLSTDEINRRVSLIVRLDPGAHYPPHTHAGLEELHLLDGELWIDDLKLYPGAYHRSVPGTSDARVWSETGCSCVLITSQDDQLR